MPVLSVLWIKKCQEDDKGISGKNKYSVIICTPLCFFLSSEGLLGPKLFCPKIFCKIIFHIQEFAWLFKVELIYLIK